MPTPKLVYNKSTGRWTRNGKLLKNGYSYYDTRNKRRMIYRDGVMRSENEYRLYRGQVNSAIRLSAPTKMGGIPLSGTGTMNAGNRIINWLSEKIAKHSGGSYFPDGTYYTGLHRFGRPNKLSSVISGDQARGNSSILDYYLKGINSGLNLSKQKPIKITGKHSDFDYVNVDYPFFPVDTLRLSSDWEQGLNNNLKSGKLIDIDNTDLVEYDTDDYSKSLQNNRRYRDNTVYDYGAAKMKIIKGDKKAPFKARTFDKFDTGKTVPVFGTILETLNNTNPLIVRHDTPIKIMPKGTNPELLDDDLFLAIRGYKPY